MDWLRRDFAFALRLLRMRWGVSSVAILVLALGISLTATMYAIIDGVERRDSSKHLLLR